jgi:hypothetical protein
VILRLGRAELHDRLNAAAYEGRAGKRERADGVAWWSRDELCDLLVEARDAVVRCPHEGCAYCFTAEKEVG